jgi:F1F0 ATPase subunit 2
MMVDVVVGLLTGIAAGAGFFIGLRWTLSRLATSDHPAFLATASFAVRSAFLVGALIAVSGGRPVRVVSGLVGILVARTVIVIRVRQQLGADPAPEASSWT